MTDPRKEDMAVMLDDAAAIGDAARLDHLARACQHRAGAIRDRLMGKVARAQDGERLSEYELGKAFPDVKEG